MILIVISITIPAFAKYLCTGHVFNATAGSSQLCLNSLLTCTESQGLWEVRDYVKQLPVIVSRNMLGQKSLYRPCAESSLENEAFLGN